MEKDSMNYEDKTNVNQIVLLLGVSEGVKTDILNSINAGKKVIVPKQEISINQWYGAGYIILDGTTGAGAYLISGGMAGGSSSVFPEGWTYYSLWKTVYTCVVSLGKMLNLGMFEIEVVAPILSLLLIITGSAISFINTWTSNISELDKISKSLLVIASACLRGAVFIFVTTVSPLYGPILGILYACLFSIETMWIVDGFIDWLYRQVIAPLSP